MQVLKRFMIHTRVDRFPAEIVNPVDVVGTNSQSRIKTITSTIPTTPGLDTHSCRIRLQ